MREFYAPEGASITWEQNVPGSSKIVCYREVSPTLDQAIEGMVAALEDAKGWCITHGMQTYSKAAYKSAEKIDEALSFYRAALKGEK